MLYCTQRHFCHRQVEVALAIILPSGFSPSTPTRFAGRTVARQAKSSGRTYVATKMPRKTSKPARQPGFSPKACRRSYAARKVVLEDPSMIERETQTQKQAQRREATFSGWFDRLREILKPSQPDTDKALSPHDGLHEALAYSTAEVTWSQVGRWNGQKAHYIQLRFRHIGRITNPIDHAVVTLKLARAEERFRKEPKTAGCGDPSLSAQQPSANPSTATPLRVVRYAPLQVLGMPPRTPPVDEASKTLKKGFGGNWAEGEQFAYVAKAHQPYDRRAFRLQRYGFEIAAPFPQGDCDHLVDSMVELSVIRNLQYRQDVPDLSIGIIVLTDGAPFVLSALTTCFVVGVRAISKPLLPCDSPARFNPAAKPFVPKGEKAIRVDFASQAMEDKMKELLTWCKPYETVSKGSRNLGQ